VHYREIRIGGAFGRGTAFRRALAMMPKLGVSKLVTARFPLSRIAEAFAHASAGHGAKTVITPSVDAEGRRYLELSGGRGMQATAGMRRLTLSPGEPEVEWDRPRGARCLLPRAEPDSPPASPR